MKNSGWKYWFLIIILIAIDQLSKIYIKTNFFIGEEVVVFPNWFKLNFTENPGVAFGMEWGGAAGKYFLSIFRVVFSGAICWFLYSKIREKEHKGILIAISLILAGAIGNALDGVFYGSIFSPSYHHMNNVANFVPIGTGYSSLLQGKVVDFFYFPLFETVYPDWVPYFGGHPFRFFNAIFNVADSCITIGLIIFLIFLRKSSMK